MVMAENTIESYFSGAKVLVTGGTGFLGKLLVEKLLRVCRNLSKIYVVVRPKKGKTCEKRLEEYLENQVFGRLTAKHPESLKKLVFVNGNCECPRLGLSNADIEMLKSEINVVFHIAATVRFDEQLRKAVLINVRATDDLLSIAKEMSALKSFVHVSTAFSFCCQPKIEEEFYDVPISSGQLLEIIESHNDDDLSKLTANICKPWPNTYVFTKAVAEDLIRRKAGDLPIAIVRPSIVLGTVEEPVPGWIDNLYGPTGLFIGTSLGLVRTIILEPNCIADQVPADFVVNNVIAASWGLQNKLHDHIPIYNCVSGPDNPITWEEAYTLSLHCAKNLPSKQMKWHVILKPTASASTFAFQHFFLHMVPAFVADLFLLILGHKPKTVKSYNKILKNIMVVSYFTTKQWTFANTNTKNLLKSLSVEDKARFNFDMESINWKTYAHTYVSGARYYILGETLQTIPEGVRKAFRLKLAHYFLLSVFFGGVLKFLLTLI